MDKISIIIPVKDEEAGLQFLIEDFQSSTLAEKYSVEFIFVIDERTTDSSRNHALKLSNNIIDQKDTIGKGSAMRQAVEQWKKSPTGIVIFLDADGSYSFQGVLKVVQELERGADVVTGCRFSRGGKTPDGMSKLHLFGNRALSMISSTRNGRRISDLCTGLWGFNKNALLALDFQSNGFDLEAEMMGLIRKKRLRHVEIPVDWSQRKGGISKLRSFRDGFIILVRILST